MKHIKHILSSVLVLVLVLASVSAVTAFASDDDPTLVLSSAEAEAGETVYLELSLENEVGVGVSTINVFFDYDETVLTLPTRKATTKDPVGQKCLSEEYFTDFTNGISPLWLADDNVYESDLLGLFAFVIAEDAKPGDYEVKLRILDAGFSDIDGEDVPCNTVSGVITVKGEDKVTYENCVDGEGNKLNPYFVNGNVWTEADGAIKPAPGPMVNFILFDTPIANNRVEATFNISLNYDGNTRNGIVFAATDIDGDHTFDMATTDVSYYWVCLDGNGNVQLWEMGAGENWAWHGNVDIKDLGIDLTQGITLAAEWDAQGHIRVFANGILTHDFVDATPLTGNLYGVLMRSWANTEGGGYSLAYSVASYVAGGELAAKNENVTITVDPEVGGTVTGAGDYYLGQYATVTATPNAGYNFAGWYWNGNLVSPDLTFTFPAG
ncbi:MAG: hypothetical protein IIU77_05785, partial [Clostridia bacterium]|nr:hypothetical protein [Clostridia bacterium]